MLAGMVMQVLCIIRRSIQPERYLSDFGFAGDWLLAASLTVHMDSGLRVAVSGSCRMCVRAMLRPSRPCVLTHPRSGACMHACARQQQRPGTMRGLRADATCHHARSPWTSVGVPCSYRCLHADGANEKMRACVFYRV